MKKLHILLFTAISWVFLSGVTSAETPIKVLIDGQIQNYDQPPILENNRTLVPLRGIFESLNAEVTWDTNTQEINATKEETTVWLKIGSKETKVNGNMGTLDVPARTKNGRTLVPLRFIGETLGCIVEWNGNLRSVLIFTTEESKKAYEEKIEISKAKVSNPQLKEVISIYENSGYNYEIKKDSSNRYALVVGNDVHSFNTETPEKRVYSVGLSDRMTESTIHITAEVVSAMTGVDKSKLISTAKDVIANGENIQVDIVKVVWVSGGLEFVWKK